MPVDIFQSDVTCPYVQLIYVVSSSIISFFFFFLSICFIPLSNLRKISLFFLHLFIYFYDVLSINVNALWGVRDCCSQVYLEERVQEVDSLTSKTQELESQLFKEKEESKR